MTYQDLAYVGEALDKLSSRNLRKLGRWRLIRAGFVLGRLWISLYHEICVILGEGPIRAVCGSQETSRKLCKEMIATERQ